MIIGVDIGGTSIKAGLLTDAGKIKKTATIATEADKEKKVIIDNILAAIDEVFDKRAKGIGIGSAGQVYDGIIDNPTNIPCFRKVNLKRIIEKNFKKKTVIDNDANCFAVAEARFGSGRGKNVVVGSIHGTGMGCGIVISGRVFGGRDNNAGEFGMVKIEKGERGVLEDFTSGRYIKKRAEELELKQTHPKEVARLASKGNKKAKKIYKEYAKHIAHACSIITCAVNPDIIILGGGTAKAYSVFGRYIRRYYKEFIVYPQTEDTKIVASKLKEPGLLGAAGLIR